jgi:transcriptional regulator with XRE-family HTH domain
VTKIEFQISRSGIKKNHIAKRCGVSLPTITAWVQGKTKIKGIHLLILADMLDVEPKELIGDVAE